MEFLLKAFETGDRTLIFLVLLYLLAKDLGPVLWRKAQGRNGASTMRGQLDRIQDTAERTHDAVIDHGARLERVEQDLRDGVDRFRAVESEVKHVSSRLTRLETEHSMIHGRELHEGV